MRVAIIEAGVVVNTVEATSEWVTANGGVPSDVAGIGWTYDDTTFTNPVPIGPEVVLP